MKISKHEFLKNPRKSLTFLGMSGVGKTYLSGKLEGWGWARYSCDYEIGHTYLREQLAGQKLSPDDIGALSGFIGKLGNPAKGGLSLDEFKNRQKYYYDAECSAVRGVADVVGSAGAHFVHDSTGSLCEIMDEELLEQLGRMTLFVYIKATPEEEKLVLERAQKYPKPLFFPPAHLEGWVQAYMSENRHTNVDEIEPDAFSRWVFPKLFTSRLPKYQRLADLYGITVESSDFQNVQNEQAFIDIIAERLA